MTITVHQLITSLKFQMHKMLLLDSLSTLEDWEIKFSVIPNLLILTSILRYRVAALPILLDEIL